MKKFIVTAVQAIIDSSFDEQKKVEFISNGMKVDSLVSYSYDDEVKVEIVSICAQSGDLLNEEDALNIFNENFYSTYKGGIIEEIQTISKDCDAVAWVKKRMRMEIMNNAIEIMFPNVEEFFVNAEGYLPRINQWDGVPEVIKPTGFRIYCSYEDDSGLEFFGFGSVRYETKEEAYAAAKSLCENKESLPFIDGDRANIINIDEIGGETTKIKVE